jgi:hypothetical protein
VSLAITTSDALSFTAQVHGRRQRWQVSTSSPDTRAALDPAECQFGARSRALERSRVDEPRHLPQTQAALERRRAAGQFDRVD